jgi:rhodanese-related sulfurtransferase
MSVSAVLRNLFSKPYRTVSAAQAAALADGGAVLLDVREPHEWQAGHAPRARHIPLSQIPRRAAELPDSRAVVTVCRSGVRSARAAAMLSRDGREVSNLAGGMRAWARAGLPVVARGGGAGRVA